MPKFLCILLMALLFEAVGVVYLSSGLKKLEGVKQISVSEVVRVVKDVLTNGRILAGVFFEAIFFFGLLYMLSKWDVTLVWPLTSLGFVVTTLAAKFFLHEHVSALRWTGVVLIVTGAMLGIYSEKLKEKQSAEPETKTAASIQPERSVSN
jgi:drug/metabolite transporter (DMT)-like permease